MKPRIITPAQLRCCSRIVLHQCKTPAFKYRYPTVRFTSNSSSGASASTSPNINRNSSATNNADSNPPAAAPISDAAHGQSKQPSISSSSFSIPPSSSSFSSLEKQLIETIKMNGPIPLALYMKQCLTSPTHGYYTSTKTTTTSTSTSTPEPSPRDPFGSTGDFITSPELTQLFGEMLALWLLTEWLLQGKRSSGVHLIELGPGRGTLMSDVLRTLGSFLPFRNAIERVFLVEASPGLRETQKRALCDEGELTMTEDGKGWRAKVKEELGGMEMVWYEDFEMVPKDTSKSPYLLAHEFFDALPIHAFQATPKGWRELLVSHRSLSTPSSKTTITNSTSPTSNQFHLTLSPTPTPYSVLLPTLSPRHPPLLTRSSLLPPSTPPITIEISPTTLTHIETFSKLLGSSPSGAALIIDYGPESTTPTNSLRGIKNHKIVSPFVDPGLVDLSVDVDFQGIAERALIADERVEVHGPVEQGAFLLSLGMRERVEMVLGKGRMAQEEEEEKKRRMMIKGAFDRLVGREKGGMGKVYKALAIVKERDGRRPVGFGGVVDG